MRVMKKAVIMKKAVKAIAMLFVVAAVVFAAGCAGKTGNTGNETKGNTNQPEPIHPENPENITENNTTQANETMGTGQVVTEIENGTSISLKSGSTFSLRLEENPSTGYSWELNLSDGLSILDDKYIEGPNPENLEGVPGTHLWVIEATAPGSQKVNGIYKRSWENITGTEEKFRLNVEVE
jgi:inhibitor of cysteine peptidase